MDQVRIVQLGYQPYEAILDNMRAFTRQRELDTLDEFWITEHPPVFTQGQAGKPEHILDAKSIPIVQSDRGGQVTYHGPGQLILYLLLDIKRKQIGIRRLIQAIEQSIIDLLAEYGIAAMALQKSPGVYVEGAKIASLGLRIRKGCSYHGLSLNVDMDLAPFSNIHPCGYPNLQVTQLRNFTKPPPLQILSIQLAYHLARHLQYTIGKGYGVRDALSWIHPK